MEQRLARNRVAHDDALVARIAAVGGTDVGRRRRRHVGVLGRRQRLQIVRPDADGFGGEPFVQHLFGANHFARVALDATEDATVAGLDGQRIVDRLEGGTLQQLHDDDGVDVDVFVSVCVCVMYSLVRLVFVGEIFRRRNPNSGVPARLFGCIKFDNNNNYSTILARCFLRDAVYAAGFDINN